MSFWLNKLADALSWAAQTIRPVEAETPPQHPPVHPNQTSTTTAVPNDKSQGPPSLTLPTIWTSKTASQRKYKIDETLHSFPFFFGTMLDDVSLHEQLLLEKDDCFLITAPRVYGEKSNSHRKWHLFYLNDQFNLVKVEITYKSQKFVTAPPRSKRLEEFMRRKKLHPIERPLNVKQEQIIDRNVSTGSRTECVTENTQSMRSILKAIEQDAPDSKPANVDPDVNKDEEAKETKVENLRMVDPSPRSSCPSIKATCPSPRPSTSTPRAACSTPKVANSEPSLTCVTAKLSDSDAKIGPKVQAAEFQPQNLSAKSASFPVDKSLIQLGTVGSAFLQLDAKRRLPCLTIKVNDKDLTPEKCKRLANEAKKTLHFGSTRIWRLWAVCYETPTKLTLLMEDIVHGSLSDHVRQYCSSKKLARFSLQIVEGLRYLEKFDFVHGRLSLDSFLLTYNENVKLIVFGLCDWTLMPECDDFEEVDRCRWMPPECQPNQSIGIERVPYSLISMVYTFGLVLWSLHHAAVLPFEDELARNIQSYDFRVKNKPGCDEELMSKEMIGVSSCLSDINLCVSISHHCWSFPPDNRPRFKELKHSMRQICQESVRQLTTDTST